MAGFNDVKRKKKELESVNFKREQHKRRADHDVTSDLDDGDDGNEDRRGTQAALVEVPASVCLARQDLVGHIPDETFVEPEPRLVQQDLPLQRSAAVGDGPPETAGAFAAHLKTKESSVHKQSDKILKLKNATHWMFDAGVQIRAWKTTIEEFA